MGKIEKRHDDEFKAILEVSTMQKLEQFFSNLPKETLSENPEKLDVLTLEIQESARLTASSLEAFELKIDQNHFRKMRYHRVLSANYKIGKSKLSELGDFIPDTQDSPEELLLKSEALEQVDIVLKSLPFKVRTTFSTYNELGYYPNHENFTNLVKVLQDKGIKTSDKTAKKDVNIARKCLAPLFQHHEL